MPHISVTGHIDLEGQNLPSPSTWRGKNLYRKQVPNRKLRLFFAINLASKITINLEKSKTTTTKDVKNKIEQKKSS